MPSDLADLETRVQRLEDERAIVDRIFAFASTIDNKEHDAWLDCFTAEGAWSWRPTKSGEPSFEVRGREQLEQWIEWHRGQFPPGEEHHALTNVRIVAIDGDRAWAESWYVVIRSEGDPKLGVRSSGRYHDALQRGGDGVWRLSERHAVGEMPRAV